MARFLIDEDLPRSLAATLRAVGYAADDIRDLGLRGASDDVVLARASASGSVLLTGDLGLASLLSHPPETHHGLVLVRGFHRGTTRSLTEAVRETLGRLSEDDLRGTIVVIQPGRLRIHRSPQ